MKLTDSPPPSDALVYWACQSAISLKMAADRPWFQAPPPPVSGAYWEYLCRCRREPVRVKRYPCEDGLGWLYLGQCRRCETVIWSYRQS
jgi:hypothetical protein